MHIKPFLKKTAQGPLSSYRWLWLLICLSMLLVTGCRGCNRSDDTSESAAERREREQKEKEKRKPPFEVRSTRVIPGNPIDVTKNYVKPGHWMTSKSMMISNYRDFTGALTTGVDAGENEIESEFVQRMVSLPKETPKVIESTFEVPYGIRSGTVKLGKQLLAPGGRQIMSSRAQTVRVMREYQFHVVCLSDQPDRHQFWDSVDCIVLPKISYQAQTPFRSYFVVNNQVGRAPPLPSHALNWTTIAYVVWNDYSPDSLSSAQQTALIDWLHWGGQLVISGPDAITALRGSFLAPYLPATQTEAVNLGADDFSALNANWAISSKKKNSLTNQIIVTDKNKLSGLTMKPNEGARFVNGTGQLVLERPVGRGRIVMTAFQLSAPAVNTWDGFSSFTNGALFLRPNRKFHSDDIGVVKFDWYSIKSASFDCMLASTLRFTSRDLGLDGTSQTLEEGFIDDFTDENTYEFGKDLDPYYKDGFYSPEDYEQTGRYGERETRKNDWYYGGFNSHQRSGVSAINNDSAIPVASRNALIDVAGIEPPLRSFVIKSLGIYLLFLVPINWLIFRLVARPELAWVAAPIISLIGAYVVIRAASLDIGFARSQSDIALVEIYAGHSRAHHSRFSALYSSLSTNYSIENEADGAIALPFDNLSDVTTQHVVREQGRVLERFQVQSNTARLLKQESFIELGGTIDATVEGGNWKINNATDVNIYEAAVVRRDSNGDYYLAWVGDLNNHTESTELIWKKATDSHLVDFWIDSNVMYSGQRIAKEQYEKNQITDLTELIEIADLELPADLMTAVEQYKEQAEKAALSNNRRSDVVEITRSRITFEALSTCLQQALGQREVHLGRLVDAIDDNMTLAKGQSRLLGWTDKLPTKIKITPDAERQKSKSLVLVHLTPGLLPTAEPDINVSSDLVGKITDFEDETSSENQ